MKKLLALLAILPFTAMAEEPGTYTQWSEAKCTTWLGSWTAGTNSSGLGTCQIPYPENYVAPADHSNQGNTRADANGGAVSVGPDRSRVGNDSSTTDITVTPTTTAEGGAGGSVTDDSRTHNHNDAEGGNVRFEEELVEFEGNNIGNDRSTDNSTDLMGQIQGQTSDNNSTTSSAGGAGGSVDSTNTTGDQSQTNEGNNSTMTAGDQSQTNEGNNSTQGQAQSNDANNSSTNSSASDQSQTNDNSGNSDIDLSDHSTSSYTYQEVYRAPSMQSQVLLMNSAPCKTFLGVQFSGADENGSNGVGLGIPLTDKDCQLEKSTRLAFQMENYELGWTLMCAQKNVRKAFEKKAKLEGYKGDERKRIAQSDCQATGVDIVETRERLADELAFLRNELAIVENQPGYDDTALRQRLGELETAAHRPDSKELFLNHEH